METVERRASSLEGQPNEEPRKLLQALLGRTVLELPQREGHTDDLTLSANLRGLGLWHKQANGLEHVKVAEALTQLGEDILGYFDRLRQEGKYRLQVYTGNAQLRPRALIQRPESYDLGDLSDQPLPAHQRVPVSYAAVHRSPLDDLPEEGHYYPLDQLYLGNDRQGVIPIAALWDLLINRGGDLKTVPLS